MRRLLVPALACAVCLVTGQAHAQWAVIDGTAIAKLVQQLRLMEQQLDQARTEFDSITGGRRMERLLAGTVRNYLPTRWQELSDAAGEASSVYAGLSAEVQGLLTRNAVLRPEQMALLPTAQRREIDAARQSAAMLQSLTRQALETTSERFVAIQELIDAIGSAEDQKAILDLQARIGAEHDMLVNENTKLQVLFQGVQAEEWARRQREKEQAIAGIGSLRELPPMGLGAGN